MADRWELYLARQRALERLEMRARRIPLLDCPVCAARRSPEPDHKEQEVNG